MRLCTICHIEKDINKFDSHRHQCRKCRSKIIRERFVKYYKCDFCDKEFRRSGGEKFCSVKCKLLKNIKQENECWIWQGAISNCGYGKTVVNGKHVSSHRLSYEIFKGKIDNHLLVCHTCDNKRCVNPDHLWLGTAKDNWKDAKNKGLIKKNTGKKWSTEVREKMKSRPHSDRRGEKHHLSKLTDNDILDIRKLLENGVNQTEISLIYGVTRSCISSIKIKRNWSHM